MFQPFQIVFGDETFGDQLADLLVDIFQRLFMRADRRQFLLKILVLGKDLDASRAISFAIRAQTGFSFIFPFLEFGLRLR